MGRHSDGILACLASSPVNMSLCGGGGWELTPQLSEYLFHEVGGVGWILASRHVLDVE